MDKLSIEKLLARIALGDRMAFKSLYDLTSSKLNGVAYCIMNDADAANEVLQDAFIQVWKNASEYRQGISEPMAWLSSIVRYRAFDRLKLDKRRVVGTHFQDDVNVLESVADSRDDYQSCAINQQLNDCLEQLDVPQKKSILMAYYYGYSREEISEYFGSPVNTVKSWLRRGLGRLQKCLAS